jgi:hypothetical protein
MKPLVLIGILLAAAGGFILVRGLTYTKDRSVFKVGDLEASLEERRSIPSWVGVVGIVGGLILVAAGAGKRNT